VQRIAREKKPSENGPKRARATTLMKSDRESKAEKIVSTGKKQSHA